MFIRCFASGTNVQRLAKAAVCPTAVIYAAYSELEEASASGLITRSIVKRQFFCTNIVGLKKEVESYSEEVQPTWSKIWDKPQANSHFIGKLFASLAGEESLRTDLSLCQMAGDVVSCFMVLVSAKNDAMSHVKKSWINTCLIGKCLS